MELKEKCDEYVLRNVKTIDIADYESFLQLNNNQEPVLTGLHRGDNARHIRHNGNYPDCADYIAYYVFSSDKEKISD